jgi:hypothetical protein
MVVWKTFVAAAAGSIVGAASMWVWQIGPVRLTPVGMTYAELAATMLAAVSVSLGALGLFLAGLAIFGFTQIREMARDTVKSGLEASLKQGDLRQHFEAMSRTLLQEQVASREMQTLIERRIDAIALGGKDVGAVGGGEENETGVS